MKIKIGVALGYRNAVNHIMHKELWMKDERHERALYSYDMAEDTHINVKYISFNKLEKKIFFNCVLQRLYYLTVKLPLALIASDVMWTHYEKDALYIALLRRIPIIGKLSAKQVSNFVWLIDDSRDYSKRKIAITSWLLKKIEKIVFLSATEKEKFINIFKCRKEQLHYIPFGINLDAFTPDKDNHPPEKLKNAKAGFILTVGTDKHRDVEAFKQLAAHMRDMSFVFATSNPQFLQMDFGKNVTVFRATLKEIRWLYKNCSMVVLPLKHNEHASGCTTILEAAAMGKPVIASNTPGMDGYLVHCETGLLVPVNDQAALKDAVEKLLGDTGYCRLLGENAYKFVKDRFTSEMWAKAHVDLTYEIFRHRLQSKS